jgi:hypothetical protein
VFRSRVVCATLSTWISLHTIVTRGFRYGVESVGSVTIESLACLSTDLATYVHNYTLCIRIMEYVPTFIYLIEAIDIHPVRKMKSRKKPSRRRTVCSLADGLAGILTEH